LQVDIRNEFVNLCLQFVTLHPLDGAEQL
jgi:hypothetical protein